MKKILIFSILSSYIVFGHPMPNSVLAFDVRSKDILCEMQLPLNALQFAVSFDLSNNANQLLQNHQKDLSAYILNHFSIRGKDGKKWDLLIQQMKVDKSEQEDTGKYEELIVVLRITPTNLTNIREFDILYDVILHQVVTHKAIVTIKKDWDNGKIDESNSEIGTISIDINSLRIIPFKVNLAKGSNWKGFKSMVDLGMKHIYEGTDHLLFLLVLLLSAPLITADNKKWTSTGNTKYALLRIFKITTAFTIGHSITLIIGAFGWITPSSKPVEILIAISILITAIHAIKPIFPKKEIFIASGFGLIHGLAFATILTDLGLETSKLILSLLGFNIGIELMQIFVIILVMPWFLILSRYRIYQSVRVFGATLAGIASIGWAIERVSDAPNFISKMLENSATYSVWVVFVLAIFTIIFVVTKKK